MISQFQPIRRSAYISLAILASLLCLLAFTRAAERNAPKPAMLPADKTPSPEPAVEEAAKTSIQKQQEHLETLELRIRSQEKEVDQLRAELGITADVGTDGRGYSSYDPEYFRNMERERMNTEARAAQFQQLYDRLSDLGSHNFSELAQALPTAVPDTEMSRLLSELNQAEAQIASLGTRFGADQPQVKEVTATISTLRGQIKARAEGILKGLQAQIAAQAATSASLSKQLALAKDKDASLAAHYRTYFRAKRDLEILQRVRDTLMEQLLERQFGQSAP
jgi:uncharacterized protein involved in exopolysaccharide biosynthesis